MVELTIGEPADWPAGPGETTSSRGLGNLSSLAKLADASCARSIRSKTVMGDEEWLDVEAAARYLNFHPNTIYRLVHDGKLPALRFPVRIRRDDLDTCVERCRILPGELAHLIPYARRR